MNKLTGQIFVSAAIIIAAMFVIVSSFRSLSSLENTLLQVFSLGLGLVGSYVIGKESSLEAARQMVKPHARSAFRRLVSLTHSLSRLVQTMREIRPGVSNQESVVILDRLESVVVEQIATAADALEDWRDILPEEIKALQAPNSEAISSVKS